MNTLAQLDLARLDVATDESAVLAEYQLLLRTVGQVRETLDALHSKINLLEARSGPNLSETIQRLEQELFLLGGAFKNAVHKVLVNEAVDSVEIS